MEYVDQQYHLRVTFDFQNGQVPAEERAEMEQGLAPLGAMASDLPDARVQVTIKHHADSNLFHAEVRLQIPGKTLTSGDWDAVRYLAFENAVRRLAWQVELFKDEAKLPAETKHRMEVQREVMAPEDPSMGLLGEIVSRGDYPAFRQALFGFEDWLRLRIGRWVQRYPEAEGRIDKDLRLGDILEEVFLSAFEQFGEKPIDTRFSDWLEAWIDPSLKLLMRHPEEREYLSMVRSAARV